MHLHHSAHLSRNGLQQNQSINYLQHCFPDGKAKAFYCFLTDKRKSCILIFHPYILHPFIPADNGPNGHAGIEPKVLLPAEAFAVFLRIHIVQDLLIILCYCLKVNRSVSFTGGIQHLTMVFINKKAHFCSLSVNIENMFFFAVPSHPLMFIETIITACIGK